jgi:hypothetical protein
VYSREINGEEYTFGVSGKLIMNVMVMYDRQTNSLWSQLLGESVEGDLQGTKLEFFPFYMTTWEDWKATHPETVAIRKGYYGARDPYDSYYNSRQPGVIGESERDDRLYIKEFVIGVEVNGESTAFPYGVLNDEPVVNVNIGGEPVLVTFNTETGTGVAFTRQLGDQVLTFTPSGDLQMTDAETGSTWDALQGEAVDGPLMGETLTRIKSTSSFWFGWKDWFPNTAVYGLDG